MDEGFDFEESLEEQQFTPATEAQILPQQPQSFSREQQQPQQQQQQQISPHPQALQLLQQNQPQQHQPQQLLLQQHNHQHQFQQQQQYQHQQQQYQQQQQQQPISLHQTVPGSHNALDVRRAGGFRPSDKKTVCMYWLKNNCHRGENCGFLHQVDASRMPLCQTFRKWGACTDHDCPFKHSMDEMKDCNMYRLGFCVYGPNCRYRHDPLPGPPPAPETLEAFRSRPHPRNGQDNNSFGRGRGRGYQSYNAPGRGIPRPFQQFPNPIGVQAITAPQSQDPQQLMPIQ